MNRINDEAKLILARWALPVSSAPVKHAALVLRGGLIETVCAEAQLEKFYTSPEIDKMKQTAVNYGDAIVTPGLINLHTHLDYSALSELYFEESSGAANKQKSMFDWLPELVKKSWSWTPAEWKNSATAGVEECLKSGTTCVVDNSFTGQSARLLAKMGMRAIVGLELFGQDESLAESAWQRWLDKFERVVNEPDEPLQSALKLKLIEITVSPHSPYTVAPALWKLAKQWTDKNDKLLLAHVAESDEECAWIAKSNESLDGYLKFMRELQMKAGIAAYNNTAPPPTPWRGQNQTPCELLHSHDLLNDHLVATHVVKVKDADIRLLKENHVKVVHCVRSNSRLHNGLAPIEKFIESNIDMGLGSDSRASSPDLDMLAEAAQVMRSHSDKSAFKLTPAGALKMITLSSAKVLRMDTLIGSLEQGKAADLAVFQYEQPANDESVIDDPTAALFARKACEVTAYVQGKILSAT